MKSAIKRRSQTEKPSTGYLRTGRAEVSESVQVSKDGGNYKSGLIEGVSLIAAGEALGHELWIDDVTLNQVAEFANRGNHGIKSRFTHPGMSSDGLGRHLGRIEDSEVISDRVVGNLHIQESAHKTPDGDLGDYVMSLADEDPAAAGLSIVFEHDWEASDTFAEENTIEGQFASPDPDNVNNYPHVRVAGLRAADIVDEPAANPDGFFDRQDGARDAMNFLDYISGLSTESPGEMFGVDPDRATTFLDRWLTSSGLSIVSVTQEVPAMATETKAPEAPPVVEAPQETRSDFAAELDRYVEAFGAENGIKWFREGLAFEDALAKHCDALTFQIKELTAANEQLKTDLANVSLGEDDPVDVVVTDQVNGKKTFAQATRLATASQN